MKIYTSTGGRSIKPSLLFVIIPLIVIFLIFALPIFIIFVIVALFVLLLMGKKIKRSTNMNNYFKSKDHKRDAFSKDTEVIDVEFKTIKDGDKNV